MILLKPVSIVLCNHIWWRCSEAHIFTCLTANLLVLGLNNYSLANLQRELMVNDNGNDVMLAKSRMQYNVNSLLCKPRNMRYLWRDDKPVSSSAVNTMVF